MGKLTGLEVLDLFGNRFSGSIPSSVSKLTRLTLLNLGKNLLTGAIPGGISKLKNLTLLVLEQNQLSGTVPEFWPSLPSLQMLKLSLNKLHGKLPASLALLAPTLAYLELGHNGLTGQIPDFLGKFQALDTLDLSGVVPKSFGNLTKIKRIYLSHNSLVDPFPVMNVEAIESLDLSYNNFHLKKIPEWVTSSPVIFSLRLARCGIKMNLSKWQPKQTYLYYRIDLPDNEISGSPVRFLSQTEDLAEFWAPGNKLKFDMGSLRFESNLKDLDLSRNSIYGKLPEAVSGLESLNVRYNHLCGQIPTTKFSASAFVGNDCLCGPPLTPRKV